MALLLLYPYGMWNSRPLQPTPSVSSRPQLDLFGKQSRSQAPSEASSLGWQEQSRASSQSPASPPSWQLFSRLVALVVQSTSSQDRLHRVVAGLSLLPSVSCCSVQSAPEPSAGHLSHAFGPAAQETWVVVELGALADASEVSMIQELLLLFGELYQQAQDSEQVLASAQTDPLTGLWNRRGFAPLLEQALSRWERSGEEVALMAIDVDHFKQINDSLGHDGGDRALEQIAKTLKETCRPSDVIARLGGDELVVLLSNCDAQGAAQVAKRCQAELASLTQGPALSLSIGVSDNYTIDGTLELSPADQLHKAADRALYQVKQEGRGGCRIARREVQS